MVEGATDGVMLEGATDEMMLGDTVIVEGAVVVGIEDGANEAELTE
jgi:hypothetical protein